MTPDPYDTDPVTERRLADAFHALATTEVPTSAPRPQHAPRPSAPARWSRSRRWQVGGGLLLAAAAATVVALVVGGEVDDARTADTAPPATGSATPATTAPPVSPPTPSNRTPTGTAPTGTSGGTASSPPASPAAVTSLFTAATAASRSQVFTVPGGFEGADLDAGTIRFWRWDGATWAVDGTSTYLPDFGASSPSPSYGATIRSAAVLPGMAHVTYLLDNEAATGDGTGVAVFYTDGPSGWGAVVAGSDADLHPSGHGITALGQDGAMYEGAITDGFLVTVDCSDTVPDMASCGDPTYQVRKSWRWDGERFVLDHRSGPAS